MSPERIAAIAALGVGLIIVVAVLLRTVPKRLKTKRFENRWQALQAKCSDKTKWPEVLSEADTLLDEALKRRRVKGKTMGERMVSAQKLFTNNDSVWFAHKLRRKNATDPNLKLTQSHMKRALLGLRQALKDLGAMK